MEKMSDRGMDTESSPDSLGIVMDPGTENLPGSQGGAVYSAFSVTPQDTVIETAGGYRLPGVPLLETEKLDRLREEPGGAPPDSCTSRSTRPANLPDPGNTFSPVKTLLLGASGTPETQGSQEDGETTIEMAPAFTDPLFPPLPVYGPATLPQRLQCLALRVTSGVLGFCFLAVAVLGAGAGSLPVGFSRWLRRVKGEDPDRDRPFIKEERERAMRGEEIVKEWEEQRRRASENGGWDKMGRGRRNILEYGGRDRLLCDIAYYARRVGLEAETFPVETEDGFLLELHHVYDPDDPPNYAGIEQRDLVGEGVKRTDGTRTYIPLESRARPNGKSGRRRYPVLLVHGLLQSAGAFCVNDEDSLAFYLVRCGYDVWLGNNRCGFRPQHTVLQYSDPRMWAWNIRQMGILDLPAFINPILALAQFPKLALISHSQGTTQTFIALAKQQCPGLGDKISVFCALAPAVYAGRLIDRFYFKFMKIIPPSTFRIVFGIHAFIPSMMLMHRLIPANLYGDLGYRMFWFLFGWNDTRWDRRLRARFFRFAPVFVSAETMRWWLGRECFARHRCVLATRSAQKRERSGADGPGYPTVDPPDDRTGGGSAPGHGDGPWFDSHFPKLAMWVAGNDELVDGRRLIRRFEEGMEPEAQLVYAKVIDEYEHLDVVWALDAKSQVFEEVAGVVWDCVEDKREVVEVDGMRRGLVRGW